jgi:hypothetical protein
VALLALLVLAGWAGAATLLVLTFLAGCCTALLSPSWNSAIVDVVPRARTAAGHHRGGHRLQRGARAGPGGGRLGLCQPPAAAGSSCWRCSACWRCCNRCACHPPSPHPPSRLPAERLWGGMLSALRFARHSETVLAQLVRTVAYSAAGSALWALLPVIAQRQLGLGAAGFGLLIGCLGAGAVVTGLVVGRCAAAWAWTAWWRWAACSMPRPWRWPRCRAGRPWSTPCWWWPAAAGWP